jgi:hypothetical protein
VTGPFLAARRAGSRLALVLIAALFAAPSARALTIVPTWDASITNDPQSATIMSTINAAIGVFQARIADPVTVRIVFQKVGTGLGASSTFGVFVSYPSWISALQTHAASNEDAIALSHLPGGTANPVNGNASVRVSMPLGRALGLTTLAPQLLAEAGLTEQVSVTNPSEADMRRMHFDPAVLRAQLASSIRPAGITSVTALIDTDAVISLNTSICNLGLEMTDPTKYSLLSVTCHEIDEVLGSGSALTGLANGTAAPTGPVFVQDCFRYTATGTRSFNTTLNDSAWFSIDGTSRLAKYNQKFNADMSDWWSLGGHTPQVQDAYNTPGASPSMNVEWTVLDVLGWSLGPQATWVDFAYAGAVQDGQYATPWRTLALGAFFAPGGGVVLIKGNTSTLEAPSINKALTITTVGGAVSIGR